MIQDAQGLARLMSRVVAKSQRALKEQGTLGKHDASNTIVTYEVRGKPGYVWVRRGDKTYVEAINRIGVPYVEDYPVEMTQEDGHYVIIGKSVHPSMPYVAPPVDVETFLELTDAPDSYAGQTGNVVAVNATEDGLEFVAPGAGGGVDTFLELTDTPADYTGQAGKVVKVNAGATALEFGDATPDPGDTGGIGTELEWFYVGGGVSADYGGNYVGWLDPDGNPWAGLTIELDRTNYFAPFSIIYNFPGIGYDSVLTLYEGGMVCASFDLGAGEGPHIQLGRNGNAATPAAAHLRLAMRTGVYRSLWIDNANQFRISTTNLAITNANDTGGTVVGTQVSSLAAKEVLGNPISPDEAIRYLMDAAEKAIKRFRYKPTQDKDESSRPFKGEEFSGLIVDYAPRYGMDKDKENPHGKSLNTPTVIGDLILGLVGLAKKNQALESQLASMEKRLSDLEKKVKGKP